MKRFTLAAALLASLASLQAQAVEPSPAQTFTVTATLAAKCISNSSGKEVAFGEYTAFQTAEVQKTATLGFKCTKGLAPTGSSITDEAGAARTLRGLSYTLEAGTPTAGTADSTGDAYSIVVTGTMAAGQPGDTSDAAVSRTHTLTIEF
jgi:opacity protein-like surface antigen